MLKFNLKTAITDLAGKPMTINQAPAMVGDICIQALDVTFERDKGETFSAKMDRWKTMVKIQAAMNSDGFVELSASELKTLQDRVAIGGLTTTIIARIGEALEGVA